MLFKCKTCEELKKQNEYLRTLIDSLLIKSNVRPVNPEPETLLEESEEEKAERARIEKGQIRYGD